MWTIEHCYFGVLKYFTFFNYVTKLQTFDYKYDYTYNDFWSLVGAPPAGQTTIPQNKPW